MGSYGRNRICHKLLIMKLGLGSMEFHYIILIIQEFCVCLKFPIMKN